MALICMFSNENDERKWEITTIGGIPPLVHIPKIGSSKVKKHCKNVIVNLYNHSEDIHSCLEITNDVPAFIGFLKKW